MRRSISEHHDPHTRVRKRERRPPLGTKRTYAANPFPCKQFSPHSATIVSRNGENANKWPASHAPKE